MTCRWDLNDEIAWVSEISDSPGSYSCLQLTRLLNIHHPELSRMCSEICSSPSKQSSGFSVLLEEK